MEKDLLDDCEFWLPPQFLTDDDLLMDFKTTHNKDGNSAKLFGNEFSYGFNPSPFGTHSDLSSPVESVVGSTETESDEDDFISGLTRRIAYSTLQENTKGLSLSRSPQSTLCGCKNGSSRGSPNGPSEASSPPHMTRPDVSMDLLYAAAGEVARIRMMEESAGLYQNKGAGIWAAPPRMTSPVPIGPQKSNPNLGSLSSSQQPPLSYQQLQVAQFQRMKQQQMMKQGQGVLGSGKNGFRQYPLNQNQQQMTRNGGARVGNLNLSNSAWPTLQQSQQQQQPQPPNGSGMRAVFLGNPGPKRECAGTGVFLPRRVGTQTEARKKPGCPVILPERVVQALNLNLQSNEGGLKYKNNNTMVATQQKKNQRTQIPVAMPQEIQLPQEWTY